jgi:hypothetical protein
MINLKRGSKAEPENVEVIQQEDPKRLRRLPKNDNSSFYEKR